MGSGERRTQRTVTLADVARAANVSPATASFVLSGRGGGGSSGSPQTKEKVRRAAEELGYVPNRAAQAMRTRRGGGIVLALGTIGDPWGIHLTRQVRAAALPHDLSTLILADERWYEYLLSGVFPDCAFLTGIDGVDGAPERVARLAQNLGGGIIAFSTSLEPAGFDVVASSELGAIAQAYRMLRDRHEVVHFLSPHPVDFSRPLRARSRPAAFLAAAREAGDGPPEKLLRTSEPGGRATYRTAVQWLQAPDAPTALIVQTGYQAVAVQVAVKKLGLRMPEDLELVSIGDVPEHSQFFEPISYFGVVDVFDRLATIIVDRARDRSDREGRLHTFTWEFIPGATTREGGPETSER